MRRTLALFVVVVAAAGLAYSGTAGRVLTYDLQAGAPVAFSNTVTAGEAFDWEVRFTTNGAAVADTFGGWMGYSTNRTAAAWVRFACATSSAGVCRFRMTAADSSGLSTNPAAYPISYPASIVLTNSAGVVYRLRAGTIVIKRDAAVSETVGAAVAE